MFVTKCRVRESYGYGTREPNQLSVCQIDDDPECPVPDLKGCERPLHGTTTVTTQYTPIKDW